MIRRGHLDLIARHSVRHSLRGGAGLIAILATIVIGLALASVVISPLQAAERSLADRHASPGAVALTTLEPGEITAIAKRPIAWVLDASDAQAEYLVATKPAIVSAILVLLVLVAPLFACLGGFNQTSGDIGSRGLRYLLFRTERQNIFLGRFIGTAIFMAAVLAILFALLGIYIAIEIHVYPTGQMLAWLGGGYLRVTAFALPYVALCAWISSAIDVPFGALVLALVVAYVWPLFVAVGAGTNAAVGYLQYLTPWGYKWWLFSERAGMVAAGFGVMLAFTAALVAFGSYRFGKRDL